MHTLKIPEFDQQQDYILACVCTYTCSSSIPHKLIDDCKEFITPLTLLHDCDRSFPRAHTKVSHENNKIFLLFAKHFVSARVHHTAGNMTLLKGLKKSVGNFTAARSHVQLSSLQIQEQSKESI